MDSNVEDHHPDAAQEHTTAHNDVESINNTNRAGAEKASIAMQPEGSRPNTPEQAGQGGVGSNGDTMDCSSFAPGADVEDSRQQESPVAPQGNVDSNGEDHHPDAAQDHSKSHNVEQYIDNTNGAGAENEKLGQRPIEATKDGQVVGELWRPAGGAYNVDNVLKVMVKRCHW